LDKLLISFLEKCSDSDWEKKTSAGKWRIKDIAAHLLDGNMRGLSMGRDHYFGEPASDIKSYHDLVGFLNDLNADWVKAMRRVSPNQLISLLKTTGEQYSLYLQTLKLDEDALFSVAWAGETQSQNWFHIAREYTEKWHHQQQIREALGEKDALFDPSLYLPYLETSIRVLPHHYQKLNGSTNDMIRIQIEEIPNATWELHWINHKWELSQPTALQSTCHITLAKSIAWRIFSKGIEKKEAIAQSEIEGRADLADPLFDAVAVMA
jgi:hypothetical protein